jgi:DNA adenine methylase
MRSEIGQVSSLLKGRTTFTTFNYFDLPDMLDSENDVVYLDPPYQGTSTNRDPRYFKSTAVTELVSFLERLNRMNVSYALSYDGHKGGKQYGVMLPEQLGLLRVEINAGRSSQSTLLGRDCITYESLYLSPALIRKLEQDSSQCRYIQPELITI